MTTLLADRSAEQDHRDYGQRTDKRPIGEIYQDALRIADKLLAKHGKGVVEVWVRELRKMFPDAPIMTVAEMCRFDKVSTAHWALRLAACQVQNGQWASRQRRYEPRAGADTRRVMPVVARGTCGECAVFHSPDGGVRGLCRVVDSVVTAQESCDKWQSKAQL